MRNISTKRRAGPTELGRDELICRIGETLTGRLNELLAKTEGDDREALIASKDHTADEFAIASLDLIQSMDVSLRERKFDSISNIRLALQRIDDGTFGQCESCEELISASRLNVVPTANLCADCKEAEETAAAKETPSCDCPWPHRLLARDRNIWKQ